MHALHRSLLVTEANTKQVTHLGMEGFVPTNFLAIVNRTIQKGIRFIALKDARYNALQGAYKNEEES